MVFRCYCKFLIFNRFFSLALISHVGTYVLEFFTLKISKLIVIIMVDLFFSDNAIGKTSSGGSSHILHKVK